MVLERTSVGLDVHARSVVAGVLDLETGEVWSRRLPPATEAVVAWIGSLPGPVGVAYEAGPTGFGLARALAAVGVRCVVVAPSKLERPAGDRVKTDRRDAERLARLLHIGELPAVRVPTELEEGARDLVRAREDARTDLMRARHRLSKLLLRHGLVFEGAAWTQAHQRWLQTQSQQFTRSGLRVAFDEADGAVLAVQARRDRLDAAIVELAMTPPWALLVGRLGCLRGIGVLTAFGLADCGSCQVDEGVGVPDPWGARVAGRWMEVEEVGARRACGPRLTYATSAISAGSADLVRAPTPRREAGHQASLGVTNQVRHSGFGV
jgi:transposase